MAGLCPFRKVDRICGGGFLSMYDPRTISPFPFIATGERGEKGGALKSGVDLAGSSPPVASLGVAEVGGRRIGGRRSCIA